MAGDPEKDVDVGDFVVKAATLTGSNVASETIRYTSLNHAKLVLHTTNAICRALDGCHTVEEFKAALKSLSEQ